ncbi:MAG: signal recognition particle-docking protein FtsY [Candidatus Anoxymicrobium japonicum]|uniref:Signal recognition particle-docking protein FtsY n=1 Tax=Candidatus Anoxymicrobium japonicum TaxID=2013648 RepID=A0A2N3G7V4_9ACTN|nr:MAG: signal recognition particle-docking protein FtsY [Candidatus Anoxymicrobium japonicum]
MAKGKKRLKAPGERRPGPRRAPSAPEDGAATMAARESSSFDARRAVSTEDLSEPKEDISFELDGVGEEEELETPVEGQDEEKQKYRRGMFRSRRFLSKPFVRAATRKAIDSEFWRETEEALIAADTGVACAAEIVKGAKDRIFSAGIRDLEGLKDAFREEVAETIRSFGASPEFGLARPHVIFIVGINGVGKTTTSAKIGYLLKERGHKVIYAAADTFRAAGDEQMEMWAHRVGAPVVRHKTGGDPGAVVFDAIESARARGIDFVIVDTAGRLHTRKNLMDELAKMWRVADRQIEGAPESILVIDATTGQNAVTQARIFSEAFEIGSIALTKMDGSAKGGVVLAIGRELGIPVSYIGCGEGLSDLRPFDSDEYARALF